MDSVKTREYEKTRKPWMDPLCDQLLHHISIEYLETAKALISNGHPITLEHVMIAITDNRKNEWFFYHILWNYGPKSADIHKILVKCLEIENYRIFRTLCEEYSYLVKPVLETRSTGTYGCNGGDQEEQMTLLQMTCSNHLFEESKILIDLGANVHVVTERGDTLLHLLCVGGNWMCYCYYPDLVALLIDSGVDPSIQNKAELTAELVADIYGHADHANYIRNYKSKTSEV